MVAGCLLWPALPWKTACGRPELAAIVAELLPAGRLAKPD
jgi:hypothetical protein